MERMAKVFIFSLFLFCVAILIPSLAVSDEVTYFYDDAGRLIAVVSGTEAIIYQYDGVGNLISVNQTVVYPPALQSISPDVFLPSATYNITLTGQHLATTRALKCDNTNISITNVTATDTAISAVLSISTSASSGQANLTVTTMYGSGSIPINLYGANITPAVLSLFAADSGSMAVSLVPSAPHDAIVSVTNMNSDIIQTQSSVTIPASGSVPISVTGLKEGTGTIRLGNVEASVYVIGGSASITAAAVCISFNSIIAGSVQVSAQPVTVGFAAMSNGSAFAGSAPVSVAWPVSVNYLSDAQPVSIDWLLIPSAITTSEPVCVKIGN